MYQKLYLLFSYLYLGRSVYIPAHYCVATGLALFHSRALLYYVPAIVPSGHPSSCMHPTLICMPLCLTMHTRNHIPSSHLLFSCVPECIAPRLVIARDEVGLDPEYLRGRVVKVARCWRILRSLKSALVCIVRVRNCNTP